MKRAHLRPGPAPVRPAGSLTGVRLLLTAWFTLVVAVGVVVLVAAVTWASTDHGAQFTQAAASAGTGFTGAELAVLLAVLGVLGVLAFAPLTWILLGYLLAPATRSVAAQESFLGAAAHDLRTPFATLTSLLTIAREDPDAREDALNRASRLVDRTQGVVEDLLLRARLASGTLPVRLRPARLDQVAEAVLADLSPADLEVVVADDGRATVTIDVGGHEVTLIAAPTVARLDPALTERAVANLVQNALRHGHRPGTPARITITVGSVDGRAAVTVADQGPGLRPPAVEAGLGLAVVRWVARGHGGALQLGTGPEPGTRIRLVFPAGPTRDLHRR